MADYTQAFDETIPNDEGKYSNDAGDSGGETVYGLTRNYDKDWNGWIAVDSYKGKPDYPNNLPYDQLLELAKPYYKTKYWDYAQMDAWQSQDLAKKCFVIAVNIYTTTAIKWLQTALNALNHNGKDYPDLTVDGVFGAKTLSAMNSCQNLANVLELVRAQQDSYYLNITMSNPANEKFINGWINRVRDEA